MVLLSGGALLALAAEEERFCFTVRSDDPIEGDWPAAVQVRPVLGGDDEVQGHPPGSTGATLTMDAHSGWLLISGRHTQMAGGIAGGRVELAASALGLGSTGLTFFDDEVTRSLEPAAQGRQVMYLVAIGRQA